MVNIITRNKHDGFGKTRSQHEENMRKEWGSTMTDGQLDKLKFMERRKKDIDGSTKNFATGIEIDEMDRVDRRDKLGEIVSSTSSERYRENFNSIDWKTH